MSAFADRAREMGHDLEGAAPEPLRDLAKMARACASLYADDPDSEECREWTALSGRYERAARERDGDPREVHGFPGDDG